MGMRIISQDRTRSIDFDRVILRTENNIIFAECSHCLINLGIYADETRASEVFEDIHNAFAPVNIISENLEIEQVAQFIGSVNARQKLIAMNDPNMGITIFDNVVYYMPEE